MRAKRLFICACILALSTLTAPLLAQEGGPPNFVKMFRSETFREGQKKAGKTVMRSFWNGKGSNLMTMQLLSEREVREAWNVTDEQHGKIQGAMMGMFTNPELAAEMKEMGELQSSGKVFGDNADPASEKRFVELQSKMVETMMEKLPAEMDKVLTDEQKRKSQEFQLAAMSDIPLVTPDMFKALDLSEDQTKKMEDIRKELEPQFDKLGEELIDAQMKIQDKLFETMEKEGAFAEGPAMFEKMQEIRKRLQAEDPEIKKLNEDIKNRGQHFVAQLKIKMFDVLTDEQWDRLQKIVDNPPDYVKNMIKKMKAQMGGGDGTDVSKNVMEAWKPGEPIPDEYRQQRQKKAFPAKEE